MILKIQKISFKDILPIWESQLWPNRTSPIREQSSMLFDGSNDMSIYNNAVYFYAAVVDNSVVGVNSVFLTVNQEYRSRGLFVFPEFRGQGVGAQLLREAIEYARQNSARFIWSLPRVSALTSYENAGFSVSHAAPDAKVEFGPNVYVRKNILVT